MHILQVPMRLYGDSRKLNSFTAFIHLKMHNFPVYLRKFQLNTRILPLAANFPKAFTLIIIDLVDICMDTPIFQTILEKLVTFPSPTRLHVSGGRYHIVRNHDRGSFLLISLCETYLVKSTDYEIVSILILLSLFQNN